MYKRSEVLWGVSTDKLFPSLSTIMGQYIVYNSGFLIYHSKLYFITNIFLLFEHVITKYLIKAEYKVYLR